jgi:hypothetical protein
MIDTPDSPTSSSAPGRIVSRHDWLALGALVLGILIVMAHRSWYDNWLSRHDLLAFFMPWHGFLGDSLRNGNIPGWSANVFSGTPFLGDPESGWGYLPAMLLFPFLQITVAMKAMILVQLLVGGVSSYSLGRVLGYGVAGATMSAFAFVFGPYLMQQTECCTVGAGVSGWIPVALLGIELGYRCRTWPYRIAMWCLAGLAISQMLAVWLGQGAAIALLVVGMWVGWRGVLDPPVRSTLRDRILMTILAGIGSLGSGLVFSAAGLLPRLAVNEESSVAGGSYANAPGARDENPAPLAHVFDYLLRDDRATRTVAIGGIGAVLLILAIVLGRRQYAVPYFIGAFAIVVALAMPANPVRDLFFLIPRFENLQIHSPTRVFWVISILPAMLAGAGLRALLDAKPRWWTIGLVASPFAILLVIDAWVGRRGLDVEFRVLVAAFLATIVCLAIVVAGFSPSPRLRHMVTSGAVGMLLLGMFAWPNVPEMLDSVRHPQGAPGTVKMWGRDDWVKEAVDATLSPGDDGAAAYLQGVQDGGAVFRFASYSGNGSMLGPNSGAPARRLEPNIIASLVNGRPFQVNLQNTSGYNPLQMLVYLQYLQHLNGKVQDYHHADIFASGAGSVLLDMLNVEYFIVDARLDPGRSDVIAFSSQGPEVYRDDLVVVYRNESALPRAWMVHDVRPETEVSLTSFTNGSFDPRATAVVTGYAPGSISLQPLVDDRVEIASYDHDRIEVRVTAGSDGFLVLADIYAGGWNATIDGDDADILQTNHTMRGIAVPAGDHTIVFEYGAPHYRTGLAISLLGGAFAVVLWGWTWWDWRRERYARSGDAGRP